MNPTELTNLTQSLRAQILGEAFGPDDARYAAAAKAFNLALDQRPAAIAFPADAEEVAAVVGLAREHGLRVAPQCGGHNAGPLGSLEDTILLKTECLDEVRIDAERRSARVGGGVIWEQVVPAASELGLAALHGSTPDVSVAGYSLGGGMGWYARRYGLAAESVTAIELVDATGERRRVDGDRDPELFWAMRGGGGNFGIVTALEFDLFAVPELYAGVLFFELERAEEVLGAWARWTRSAPEEITSVGRLMQFPPFEEVPEPMRGRSFVLFEAAFLGSEAAGAELIAPLRDLGAEIDTFASQPPAALAEMHMDPRDPMPYVSHHALLGELPEVAIERLVAAVGPGSGSTLASVEIRHTGGALARPGTDGGPLSPLPGEFATFAAGVAADPHSTAKSGADLAGLDDALAPNEVGSFPNFLEAPLAAESAFGPDALRRLLAAREAYDPARLFHANHELGAGR